MLNEALRAQKILWEKFEVPADVWSVTSYNELRREALDCDRWNRLHPAESARKPFVAQRMEGTAGTDHRRQRLHEGGGRSALAVARPAPAPRWEPTASAAAKAARTCAASSKWTPSRSSARRWSGWRARVNSIRSGRSKPTSTSASIRTTRRTRCAHSLERGLATLPQAHSSAFRQDFSPARAGSAACPRSR